ncbi:MAG: hypothetical protein AAGG51_18160 [Cyanobacteria bacterium P01_G01_bin.54]
MKDLKGSSRQVTLIGDNEQVVRKRVNPKRVDRTRNEIVNFAVLSQAGINVPAYLGSPSDLEFDFAYISGHGYVRQLEVSPNSLHALAITTAAIVDLSSHDEHCLTCIPQKPQDRTRILKRSMDDLEMFGSNEWFSPYLGDIEEMLSQDYATASIFDMTVRQFIYNPHSDKCYLVDAECFSVFDYHYSVAKMITSMLGEHWPRNQIEEYRTLYDKYSDTQLSWSRVGLWCAYNDLRLAAIHKDNESMQSFVGPAIERLQANKAVPWTR